MSGGKILSEVAVEREIVLSGKACVCMCVCVWGGGGGGGKKEEKGREKSEDEKARENIEKRACNR